MGRDGTGRTGRDAVLLVQGPDASSDSRFPLAGTTSSRRWRMLENPGGIIAHPGHVGIVLFCGATKEKEQRESTARPDEGRFTTHCKSSKQGIF